MEPAVGNWEQGAWLAGIVLVLFGTNCLLEDYLNPYFLRVVIHCGIAMVLALSLNLVNGCAGQFSLGHAGFMGMGAYISTLLTTVLPLGFFDTGLGVGVAIFAGGMAAA